MGVSETIKADPLVGARMLIAEYGDRLYAVALILEQESHSAEDLVSRTVRQAVVKIDRFDSSYSFWNWLYTIMLNFYRTDQRKQRAEVADEPDFVERKAECLAVEEESEPDFPRLDAELLREAVARLPPSLRTVVALRYFEDKTLAEMITIMGMPPGTVKSQLHRARLRLKEVLSRLFKEGERANEL